MTKGEKSWLLQTAAIIETIVEKHMFSQATLEIGPDDAWFKESCNFIGLVCDLKDFTTTLKNMVKYAEKRENV